MAQKYLSACTLIYCLFLQFSKKLMSSDKEMFSLTENKIEPSRALYYFKQNAPSYLKYFSKRHKDCWGRINVMYIPVYCGQLWRDVCFLNNITVLCIDLNAGHQYIIINMRNVLMENYILKKAHNWDQKVRKGSRWGWGFAGDRICTFLFRLLVIPIRCQHPLSNRSLTHLILRASRRAES